MRSADCFSCFLASSLSPNALMNFSFGFSSFVSVKEFCYYHCFLDIYNVHIIHTCPMYILYISNVCIMHIQCLYNTIQCIYHTYPMHIYYTHPMYLLYIPEIISALVCSSIWTDPHCRYSIAISLLSNAPFISSTYLKGWRHFLMI